MSRKATTLEHQIGEPNKDQIGSSTKSLLKKNSALQSPKLSGRSTMADSTQQLSVHSPSPKVKINCSRHNGPFSPKKIPDRSLISRMSKAPITKKKSRSDFDLPEKGTSTITLNDGTRSARSSIDCLNMGSPRTTAQGSISTRHTGGGMLQTKYRPSTMKKSSEIASLECQLSTKRKNFSHEKKKLLDHQTRIIDLYKSIQSIQAKLDPNSPDANTDFLKLVAYAPNNNNYYICKESGGKYAVWAESRRNTTIQNFKLALSDINKEMCNCQQKAYKMCQQMLDRNTTFLVDLKKARHFEIELLVKKMQLFFKDIELMVNDIQKEGEKNIEKFMENVQNRIFEEENNNVQLEHVASQKEIIEHFKKGISVNGSLIHAESGNDITSIDCKGIDTIRTQLENLLNEYDPKSLNTAVGTYSRNDDASSTSTAIQIILNQLRTQLENKTQEISRLKNLNDSIENELKAKTKQTGKLNIEVLELQNRIKELEEISTIPDNIPEELRALREAGVVKSNEIRVLNQKIELAKKEIQKQDDMIQMHQRLLQVRSDLILNLQDKDDTNQKRLDELRYALQSGVQEVEQCQTEIGAKSDDLNKLYEMISFKDLELKRLENRNQSQQQLRIEQEARIERLERENSQLKQHFEQIMSFSEI